MTWCFLKFLNHFSVFFFLKKECCRYILVCQVCFTCCHLKSRDAEGETLSPHIKTPSDHVLCLPKLCPLSTDYLLPKLGISFPTRNSSRGNFICGASFPGVNSVLNKTPQRNRKSGPLCRVSKPNVPIFCLASPRPSIQFYLNKLKPFNTNTV
jgi:hypothetical protein